MKLTASIILACLIGVLFCAGFKVLCEVIYKATK